MNENEKPDTPPVVDVQKVQAVLRGMVAALKRYGANESEPMVFAGRTMAAMLDTPPKRHIPK
jgi:hypothetical protein